MSCVELLVSLFLASNFSTSMLYLVGVVEVSNILLRDGGHSDMKNSDLFVRCSSDVED